MERSVLPYHQFMTPKWLTKHATIYGSYTYTNNYLDIPTLQRIIEVVLVPPEVISNDEGQCVTVIITIGMDTTFADGRSDHDPHFGISDGENFIGFIVVDKNNYATIPPCYSAEGDDVKNVLTNLVYDSTGPRLSNPSQGYSSEVKIQIRRVRNGDLALHNTLQDFVLSRITNVSLILPRDCISTCIAIALEKLIVLNTSELTLKWINFPQQEHCEYL